jgi:hypothetical protein
MWNYRILEAPFDTNSDGSACTDPTPYLQLIECFYDEQDRPNGYTFVDRVFAEPDEGLKWTLEKMLEAASRPILKPSDFEREAD